MLAHSLAVLWLGGGPAQLPPDPTALPAPVESAEREPESAPLPMPEIEELPTRDPEERQRRSLLDLSPDPDRPAAGSNGGSFFDPGKIADDGPGGGIVEIRGYVGTGFFVTERTNIRERRGDGGFEQAKSLPFFGGGVATLYVGAAIWADAVYARIALDYVAVPQVTAGTADILAPATRRLLMESAAIEVNPFFWAERSRRWLREGFKITAGIMIVPFGLEDEAHAAPINWFVTRTRSMTVARVYPGTWSDVGAILKFKPTFRPEKPIRPFELDFGVINGDACTQTRWADVLYQPTGQPAPCERVRREEEVAGDQTIFGEAPRADFGVLGVTQDNNQNKSVVGRLKFFPLPALNFGASIVYGKHPRQPTLTERLDGLATIDLPQARSYRVGGHLDLDFDQMFSTRYPLPALRAEVVYGSDEAARDSDGLADRTVLGAYGQVAQPLYRRKRSNLPGLVLQYRFDYADPDLAVPDDGSVPLRSDFSDAFLYDEAIVSHTVGLRLPVLPRFGMKAEYTFLVEDGGRENQLYNDHFGIQLIADF